MLYGLKPMDFRPIKGPFKFLSQKELKNPGFVFGRCILGKGKAKQSSDQHFLKVISILIRSNKLGEEEMAGQEVKQLEECSVSNALGTWVFSVAGALLAIPVGIKRKSLAPLVFFGTTGTMLDIIMGISACEREHAERQMKLLEAQNSAADDSSVSES
ncbi:hypothetical protein QUC31_000951 [Theobroma cacao]